MAVLLHRLGLGAYRHRKLVLGIWLAVLAALVTCAGVFGGKLDDRFTVPGTESQRAMDMLGRTLPEAAGAGAQIVFTAPGGHHVTEARYTAAIAGAETAAAKAPQVRTVMGPERLRGRLGRPEHGDRAGAVLGTAGRDRPSSLTARTGGRGGREERAQDLRSAERLRQQRRAHRPVRGHRCRRRRARPGRHLRLAARGGHAAAVGAHRRGRGSMGVLRHCIRSSRVSSTAADAGADDRARGRHRLRPVHPVPPPPQLAPGMDPEESAALAVATAGSAVVFAGVTVIIALVGLLVVGIPFLAVMGVAAAVAVLRRRARRHDPAARAARAARPPADAGGRAASGASRPRRPTAPCGRPTSAPRWVRPRAPRPRWSPSLAVVGVLGRGRDPAPRASRSPCRTAARSRRARTARTAYDIGQRRVRPRPQRPAASSPSTSPRPPRCRERPRRPSATGSRGCPASTR